MLEEVRNSRLVRHTPIPLQIRVRPSEISEIHISEVNFAFEVSFIPEVTDPCLERLHSLGHRFSISEALLPNPYWFSSKDLCSDGDLEMLLSDWLDRHTDRQTFSVSKTLAFRKGNLALPRFYASFRSLVECSRLIYLLALQKWL